MTQQGTDLVIKLKFHPLNVGGSQVTFVNI